MSRLFFNDTYITVIPTYESTEIHSHSMMHVFVGKEPLTLEGFGTGKILLLDKNIPHRKPLGNISFFLFVDPTSMLAEKIKTDYLKGFPFYSSDDVCVPEIIDAEKVRSFISGYFGIDSITERKDLDPRVLKILNEADSYKYLDIKVSDLAGMYNYSESYLTHLFKKETGVNLKNYLLLRRFEYVWTMISKGEKITTAVIQAGFSSPSHFSDTCKKLTGISAAEVMR